MSSITIYPIPIVNSDVGDDRMNILEQKYKKLESRLNNFTPSNACITVLLPNDSTFSQDVENPVLLQNNKECYNVLKHQTEPITIYLKYLNANKPLSQSALRLRHLYAQGEGDTFFAFGYPTTYNNDSVIGGLALSSDMYSIYEDGTTKKIDYNNGDVMLNATSSLFGSYNQKADSTGGATLANTYLPRIYQNSEDGYTYIENLFGGYSESGATAVAQYDPYNQVLTVKGGWLHPSLGDITSDIVFNVDLQNGILTSQNPINIGDWAVITGYTLYKIL